MARILIVDDDVMARQALERGFIFSGHTPVAVPELAQASAKVSEEDFDLVILDLQMRGEHGATFLKELRDARSDIPIVIYSGMVTESKERELRQAGANEVVLKGGDFSELLQKAEKILKAKERLFGEPARERVLLVVDDDERIQQMLNEFFSKRKYRVLEAPSGEEGLAIARQEKIDCVLLDIHLPGMSGMEVLPKLLQNDPQTGVVMISGEGDEHFIKEATENGAYGYVTKPFDFVYLELTVASKLAIAGSG